MNSQRGWLIRPSPVVFPASKQYFFLFHVQKTSSRAKHKKAKEEAAADLLRLCHTVPLEVVGLGRSGSFGRSLIGTELKAFVPTW